MDGWLCMLCFTAAVFGEPHFISFDGTKFIFNGYGEFTLVSALGANLNIQGRMAQIKDTGKFIFVV